MVTDWKQLTDYDRCACCGQPLDGMIQETIPGKKRILVTCQNEDCHEKVKWQTLRVHEHVALCFALNLSDYCKQA